MNSDTDQPEFTVDSQSEEQPGYYQDTHTEEYPRYYPGYHQDTHTEEHPDNASVFINETEACILGDRGEDGSSSNVSTVNLKGMKINTENNIKEDFYNLTKLKETDDLYSIFSNCDLLIFIDNKKLTSFKFTCIKSFKNLKFPGCTFLPFEYVTNIKKYIHELNTLIANNELKNIKVMNDNDYCNSIYFDEGDIKKNVVYKKMEVMDKIIMVPLSKYQIKQTEYKLRGFCQIAEELGAKDIEIKFEKLSSASKKKNIKFDTQINLFAGELGLVSNNSSDDKEKQSYTLEYPSINTISLNEKSILKKIRKKKFIISENMYNSNLELQYLVHSRCRHFITKYSTVFNLDSNINIDKNLNSKFKHHGISTGANISVESKKSNCIKIITNINFSKQEDYFNHLGGHSVSLDKVGFKYLIESFNKDEEKFKTNGVFKIMTFLELYIERIVKHEKDSRYDFIKNILEKVKEHLSLDEYSEILCNYFNCTSQWIHFKNFIDLLSNKTHSYDKLGYLIIINDREKLQDDKLKCILRFIQEKCINEGVEKNFWEMLKPHKRDLKFTLKEKLYDEYDFIDFFNWYGITNLIKDISKYNINISNDREEEFKQLVENINIGYSYIEFYENMVPFILRYFYSLNYQDKNVLYISNLLEQLLNYESFTISKIHNIKELEDYIKIRTDRIKFMFQISETIKTKINNVDINVQEIYKAIYSFISENSINDYKYFIKKLNIICENNIDMYLFELISPKVTEDVSVSYNYDINGTVVTEEQPHVTIQNENIDNLILNFLKKLLIYNDKLNVEKLPLNNFGFQILLKNYNNGIKQFEFHKRMIYFIKKMYKNIISNNFCVNSNEYKILINVKLDDILNYNIINSCNIDNFYDLIFFIKNYINSINENINIDDKDLNNLCFS